MTNHSSAFVWLVGVVVLIGLFVATCGSAPGLTGGNAPGSTQANIAVKAAQDPKIEEAKERCEAEKKKSEIQPPDQLEPIHIHACIFALKPEIAKCSKGLGREIVLKLIIEKTGAVSNAFPVGDTADCPEATCIADAVKSATFPKFKAATQQVIKYPFKLGQ